MARSFAYGESDHYFGGPVIVANVTAKAKACSAFSDGMVACCHFHLKVGLRLSPERHTDTAVSDVVLAFRGLV